MLFRKPWIILYLLILAADITSILLSWSAGELVFKTLLMPVLVIGLLQNKKTTRQINWRVIMAGLLTAWAGDVMLLFASGAAKFFMLGLVCFLITHIAYILYFQRYKAAKENWFIEHPIITFLVVMYSITLYAVLQPYLGSMMAPVGVYTFVISIMMLRTLSVQPLLPISQSGKYFIAGSALFVVSDSILAVNKFHTAFTLAGPLIMLTYGLAQLLIVLGAIKNTD
jgi:uncharacterized membrane protein YhhN